MTHIMQELPTNMPNFLFENLQDFNQTTYVAPHRLSVLFSLSSVHDFLKRSYNGHVMVYVISIFISREHFHHELLSISACISTLSSVKNVLKESN